MADENAFEVEMVNHDDDFTLITSSPQICSSQLVDFAIEEARNNKEASMEMDFCKAIVDKNAFQVEMVNHEDDSTTSPQICSSQLLDFAIEDATNNKKILVSAMDSVISLMRQVECEEKAAEEAKEEAAKSSLHILAMVDQLEQAQQLAKETNAMVVDSFLNKFIFIFCATFCPISSQVYANCPLYIYREKSNENDKNAENHSLQVRIIVSMCIFIWACSVSHVKQFCRFYLK